MNIPKLEDLTACSYCKGRFHSKEETPNIKRCNCCQYVYSTTTLLPQHLTMMHRSIRDGSDVYVLKCQFTNPLRGKMRVPEEIVAFDSKLEHCSIQIFKEGSFGSYKIDIPDSMMERVPVFESSKKIIKFCNTVKLLK